MERDDIGSLVSKLLYFYIQMNSISIEPSAIGSHRRNLYDINQCFLSVIHVIHIVIYVIHVKNAIIGRSIDH